MMPITGTIESFDQFKTLIDSIQYRSLVTGLRHLPLRFEFYRGQADSRWDVTPSLARGLVSEQQVIDAETEALDFFKYEITRKNCLRGLSLPSQPILTHAPIRYTDEWYWRFQAQHYGIPTRLLDWSIEAKIALWFAVSDPAYDHVSGQFLVASYPQPQLKTDGGTPSQDFHLSHPDSVDDLWMINPGFYYGDDHPFQIAERRRSRQQGRFSIQPFATSFIGLNQRSELTRTWEDTYELEDPIPIMEKYIIPAEYKLQLRLKLISMGISNDAIYIVDQTDPAIELISLECCEKLKAFKDNLPKLILTN